jgi:hypothetical protein
MALDPRKRQKKLERKTAKRKVHKQFQAPYAASDVYARFQRAAGAPIVHSRASDSLWQQGIGHVLLSREVTPGQFAFAAFLLDVYCLGVKDAMWNIRSRDEIESLAGKLMQDQKVIKMKPECTRKLVEGAVEYARNLGFPPREDYQRARLIFGDIDSAACSEEFVYGRNGKPFFIAGPYDGPARCRQILHILNSRLGPQGHHFLMPVDADDPQLESVEMIECDWHEDA